MEIKAVRHTPHKIGDDDWPNNLGVEVRWHRQKYDPGSAVDDELLSKEDLIRISVAWPLNEEIISATPTLVRVSREAEEDEETASSVH